MYIRLRDLISGLFGARYFYWVDFDASFER